MTRGSRRQAACWLVSIWGRRSRAGKTKDVCFRRRWRGGRRDVGLSLSTWLRGSVGFFFLFRTLFPPLAQKWQLRQETMSAAPRLSPLWHTRTHTMCVLRQASVCQRHLVSCCLLFIGIISERFLSQFCVKYPVYSLRLYLFFCLCPVSFIVSSRSNFAQTRLGAVGQQILVRVFTCVFFSFFFVTWPLSWW